MDNVSKKEKEKRRLKDMKDSVNFSFYYMGGDSSKGYCDFVILDANQEVEERNFQLDDTPMGHKILQDRLRAFFARRPHATLHVGFESTGGYENNWYNMFLNLSESRSTTSTTSTTSSMYDVKVTRLNPLGIKRHMESNLARNKTDKISARAIAEYLISHKKNIIYNQSDSQMSLRKYWSFIKLLTKQKTQLMNRFEKALYNSNPEILTYCQNDVPQWVFKVLAKYPTAHLLAEANAKTLAQIPFVTLIRAKELIKNAKISIGAEQDEITARRIRSLVRQIVSQEQLIKEQVEEMSRHCSSEELETLTSFKGIGKYSAVGLLFIIGDINRFESSKKISSYIGVHPALEDSGDGTKVVRMSKKGSKEARVILFNVAMNAIVNNEMIKELYEGYLAKGKCKMAAIGIMMHKIFRIIYGMLKHRKKYDPSIDEANRNKTREKEKNTDKAKQESDKNRRYQPHDQNAPISRRQAQKRKNIQLQKNSSEVEGKGDKENVINKKGKKASPKSRLDKDKMKAM
jgi:transposase